MYNDCGTITATATTRSQPRAVEHVVAVWWTPRSTIVRDPGP